MAASPFKGHWICAAPQKNSVWTVQSIRLLRFVDGKQSSKKILAVIAPSRSPQRHPSSTGSVKNGMTMTEKILARASERSQLEPGENVWVNVDVLMTHDVCGPGAIGTFKREFGENAKVVKCYVPCNFFLLLNPTFSSQTN
ncbi:hypothetical protein HPP92_026398 [Vanilla planifolia]|uniref:3-isopropylmalate dehydratase large subunit n=1 Tax=Vanilla planifolia TaxID=51239 RepID=A0A835U858_VANPL|nr:hypothetical protein HPP92_026398 [Vanilla planifolia]